MAPKMDPKSIVDRRAGAPPPPIVCLGERDTERSAIIMVEKWVLQAAGLEDCRAAGLQACRAASLEGCRPGGLQGSRLAGL